MDRGFKQKPIGERQNFWFDFPDVMA